MSELILWKDQEMNKLRRDMDRLFNRFRSHWGAGLSLEWFPESLPLEVTETRDALIVKAELPGVDPKDLSVSVTNDTLFAISGEKRSGKAEEDGHTQRIERRFHSFSRTLRLPCRVKVGEVKASYKEGILEIFMPKWEPHKARGIKVEVQ